jgi:hypothetical protein
VVRAIPSARQRVAKHIPAGTNPRKNSTSTNTSKQRRGKQALSIIQDVFSMDPSRDYISSTEQNEIRENQNGASPRQSRKKGSAED